MPYNPFDSYSSSNPQENPKTREESSSEQNNDQKVFVEIVEASSYMPSMTDGQKKAYIKALESFVPEIKSNEFGGLIKSDIANPY
jgi:hypothetical protein